MDFDQLRNSLAQLQARRASHGAVEQLQLDLEVHQVKLEMQNRELTAALAELEDSRESYAELYDFAPVPCLTLDRAGVIHELNLATAALLGRERDRLRGHSLLMFVAGSDRGRCQEHLIQAQPSPGRLDLTLHAKGRTFPVQMLTAHRRRMTDGKTLVRAAIIELSPSNPDGQASPDGQMVTDAIGQQAAEPVLASQPSAEHDGASRLSQREEDVVRLIALGYSNKEIAAQLSLSVKTVETYKARSLEKLGMSSRAELVRHALLRGWLKND